MMVPPTAPANAPSIRRPRRPAEGISGWNKWREQAAWVFSPGVWRDQDRLAAGNWRAEPLRQDDEDLHLGQIRSPAQALVNGRRQARQLRTLGSMSPSGTGFL